MRVGVTKPLTETQVIRRVFGTVLHVSGTYVSVYGFLEFHPISGYDEKLYFCKNAEKLTCSVVTLACLVARTLVISAN